MPSHKLKHIGTGFTPAKESDLQYIIDEGRYLPHDDVTAKPEFLQIVPSICVNGSGGDHFVRKVSDTSKSFLAFTLMEKTHILHKDRSIHPIKSSVNRLVEENFMTPQPFELRFIGYVRDNHNRSDHIGLVYKLQSKTKKGVKAHKPYPTGVKWQWLTDKQVIDDYYRFKDPWDRMMIDKLFVESRA